MIDDVQLLVQTIVENAKVLGIKWQLRPASIAQIDISRAIANVFIDGDDTTMSAINLIGGINLNARVMCLIVPNEAVYIIGKLGNTLDIGELVCRVRQATPQTIANAGSGTFLDFDTVDYDPFGFFSTSNPDRVTPTIPGWYTVSGRVVFTGNATSRRACFVNTNGTTSGTGTRGGQSLQTPATGSCQISAIGDAECDGVSDFFGIRVIQNSGANLDTLSDATDGGSCMEVHYAGPGRI